jgi:SAM-dependent methyltransferase|tara:strand:- start:21 stop:719 length:699 start_codon:yes stop_codon:yes gene_type:complete
MDAFGRAGLDFLKRENDEFIYVESETMEDDVIPVEHLFRSLEEMPDVEKKALKECVGKVLDVGGGVGSHSLFLQDENFDVTLLDICDGLCAVANNRGVKKVIYGDFFDLDSTVKYDTLIFMMNGIGIGGSFDFFEKTIQKATDILNPNGIVLFDSTDISFCYEQEDGSVVVPLNIEYSGFVKFRLRYKDLADTWFNWAYYDMDKLSDLLPDHLTLQVLHEEGPAYSAKISGF